VVWQELGRRAADDPWSRRFLLDVAHGRLPIAAEDAVPAFRELARARVGDVRALLEVRDSAAPHVAAAALAAAGGDLLDEVIALSRSAEGAEGALVAISGLAQAASVGVPRAVAALAELLGDRDGEVRLCAAAALGRARGRALPAALARLEAAVQSPDERVLCGLSRAAVAVAEARPAAARALLLRVSLRGRVARRSAAVAAAGLPRRAAARLAARCVSDPDPEVRAAIVPALARWAREGSGAALREIERLACDPSAQVRAPAAFALICCSRGNVDGLAGDRSPQVRAAVAEAIGRAHRGEAREALRRLARDRADVVRAAAVRSLALLGATEGVCQACADHAPAVRAAAAQGLPADGPEDLARLLLLSTEADQEVVRAAAAGLGRAGTGPGGPAWERLLELAREPTLVRAAAAAMVRLLDAEPAAGAAALWRWPLGETTGAALAVIARRSEAPAIIEVARGLRRALEGDDLAGGLDDVTLALADLGLEREAAVCRWLAAGAHAAGCEDIAALARAPGAKEWAGGAPLLAAAGACRGARRARLERARSALGCALRLEAATPEQAFIAAVAEHWDGLLRERAGGSVAVRAWLESERVVAGPGAGAVVVVENAGREAVREVSVGLGDQSVPVGDLPAGARARAFAGLAARRAGRVQVRGVVRYRSGEEERSVALEGGVRAVRPPRLADLANPYVVGKPLPSDSEMFFGRGAEIAFVERALASGAGGSVVCLVGRRRTGKTSLLKRLQAVLAYRCRTAFVDVQGLLVGDVSAFFAEVAAALAGERLALRGEWEEAPSAGLEMVRAVAEGSEMPSVLLLDEFDDLETKVRSGRLGPEVFDQLRHLIQHVGNLAVVLCGTHRLEELAGEHWSFLLNLAVHRRLGGLEPAAAEEVLAVPLARLGIVYDDAALARALALAGRHPYLLQLLGYRLVEDCARSGEGAVRLADVERAADEVVEQGDVHLRYLWDTAGEDARAALRALCRAEPGLTPEELAAAADLDAAAAAAAARELAAADLLAREGERYRLAIGLLGRWLAAADPDASGGMR